MMRKCMMMLFALMMVLMLECGALAQDYYTLPEIREQAAQGWHETYTDKYGRETVVDIDIDVFGEDTAPVLRAGYPGHEAYRHEHNDPRGSIKDARLKKGGESTFLYTSSNGMKIDLDYKYGEGYGNNMTPREAYAFLEEILEVQGLSSLEYLYDRPAMFEVLCSIKPSNGEILASALYYFGIYPKLYEFPIIMHVSDTYEKGGVGPRCSTTSSLQIRNREEYSVVIKPFIEQEKLAEDIPLCSLDTVIESIEKEIEAGYIQHVNSLRFGYVLYNDPKISIDKRVVPEDVESWYVVPSWVLECGYSKNPKKDWNNDTSPWMMVINVQTGEMSDPLDKSVTGFMGEGETRYQGFIPWDDVK